MYEMSDNKWIFASIVAIFWNVGTVSAQQSETASIAEAEPVQSDDALQKCRAERDNLIAALRATAAPEPQQCPDVSGDMADIQQELSECSDDARLQKTTNIQINKELIALRSELENCVAAPAEEDPRVAELEAENRALRVALDAAQQEVEALTDRLDSVGLKPVATFNYAAGDAFSSAVRASEIQSLLTLDKVISAESCPDALDWLMEQKGSNRRLVDRVWVRSASGSLLVCETANPSQPTAQGHSVEAHVVEFK